MWQWLRRDRLTAGVLGSLLVAGTIWFFTIDSGFGFRGPRVDGDGIYFWLNLRSLVMDRDVDFSNDYAVHGNPWNYGPGETGLPMNPATVGSALLWAPFYLPARGVVALVAHFGGTVRSDGTSHAEELSAFYGSFIYGFLALLLALELCRRHYPHGPALLGVVSTAVGGSLVFYMVVQPSMSHAPAAFAVAAFVERWDVTRGSRTLRGWAALGALGGLAMLIRPQLAVLAVLPLFDLVRDLFTARSDDPRRPWLQVVGPMLGAVVAVVVFSPQMAIWHTIHGRLIAVPQGSTFMQWGSSLWSEVLFHPRAGLLPWMPLALPALVGLGILVCRRWEMGLPLLLLLGLMTYVNGASWDWWAGYSYGARRFTALYVLLALGLVATLDLLWRWAQRRTRAVAAGAGVALVGGFCLLNLSMINNRRHHALDWYKQREFYKVYLAGIEGLERGVNDHLGNPLSWPANLVFAARHGVSPAAYDVVAGRYFLDEKHGIVHRGWAQKRRDDLKLTERGMKPFLARGFGGVRPVAGREGVLVIEPRACILLPLIQRPGLRLELWGGSLNDATVTLQLNGETLGIHRLSHPWQVITERPLRSQLRRGVNELCLLHEVGRPPAVPPRRVGTTSVVSPVDLAAFSRISPEDGAQLWVGGRRVGTNQRGINAAAVDPHSGELLATSGFDLAYWPQGGEMFARWIDALPRGTMVMLAVRIDASRLFDKHAVRALTSIGAVTNLRLHPRQSYVAMGVKGATPGTALEAAPSAGAAVAAVGRKPLSWTGLAHYDRLSLIVTRPMTWR